MREMKWMRHRWHVVRNRRARRKFRAKNDDVVCLRRGCTARGGPRWNGEFTCNRKAVVHRDGRAE